MQAYKIIRLVEHPEYKDKMANWFHQKWGIPLLAYEESMDECLKKTSAIPQWYVVLDKDNIIGGLGVIQNDFHNRKDLSPNVCGVYVEEQYRKQGIAGKMLQFVCDDMKKKNIPVLYLVTDHTSFYERYGWQFLCMVQGDNDDGLSRMYMHRT